jgi:PKD repeat protein
VVTVRDVDGSPKRNIAVRLTSSSPSFGTITPSTAYTDSNGQAVATYTPPTASPFTYGAPPLYLTVFGTPIGSNYQTANPATVEIEVLTPAVPASAPGDPVASVAVSATSAKVGQIINFDASQSAPGTGAAIADYIWDFGDGLAHDEHGADASHAYTASGSYTVTLGVVDTMGRKRGTFKQILVTN